MIDTLGCTLFLELGPDDKLAGMVNRIRKGTEVLSVSRPGVAGGRRLNGCAAVCSLTKL